MDKQALLKDLARAKAAFQKRTLVAILDEGSLLTTFREGKQK